MLRAAGTPWLTGCPLLGTQPPGGRHQQTVQESNNLEPVVLLGKQHPGCIMLLGTCCDPTVLLGVISTLPKPMWPCSRSCCKCYSPGELMSICSPLKQNGCMAGGLTCGEWMCLLVSQCLNDCCSHSYF